MEQEIKPFGTWGSTLTAQTVAGAARRFSSVQGCGQWIYWSEGRPSEGGRQAIMRVQMAKASRGSQLSALATPAEDVLLAPYSARSKVHEYGGGEFLVDDGVIYFANDADQGIYVLVPGGEPERLTIETTMRFADFARDKKHRRLIAVCERKSEQEPVAGAAGEAGAGAHYPQNLLVSVGLMGAARGKVSVIASGHDFYAAPRLSPDGKHLSWLAWDLPDMPWDQAVLYVADLGETGQLSEPRLVAGGDGAAVFQPQWMADGTLIYVSDGTGWANLYGWDGAKSRCLYEAEADFGRPLWQFGMTSYALVDGSAPGKGGSDDGQQIVVSYFDGGEFRFARLNPVSGEFSTLATQAALLDRLTTYSGGVAAIAGRHDAPPAIVAVPLELNKPADGPVDDIANDIIIRSAADLEFDAENVSRAQVLKFSGGDGDNVYGSFYPPVNGAYKGSDGELPPCIVTVHGGPTASADRGLKLRTQFYTTRGFAVFDVDYVGSANYGRAYRERLDGKWGIADVADCTAAAKHLASKGLVDAKRIVIQGGSAGGYTVLMALATTDVFAAGASHYGISDLQLLQDHTHKFEGGYLQRLLGTTPDTAAEIFKARSPLTLIDGMTCPVILFQGLDDKVVPPEQSRLIAQQLRDRGVEVAHFEFAGEGHGFRRADTIITVLQEELAFLQRVLGLNSATG